MRRRSFVTGLPITMVAPSVFAQTASAPKNAQARTLDTAVQAARFQPAGSARFDRPDVHAGDRPSGASFASRSAAFGLSGAAGTAHPVATLSAIETVSYTHLTLPTI